LIRQDVVVKYFVLVTRVILKEVAVSETCFVVMAIGDQTYDGVEVTAASLRDGYTNVIREALIQARPDLDVIRSDEVSIPGTITTDILNRLMHSTFCVVDVTYPNPNVFYELGIRNACKPGTILIRDKEARVRPPFDVSHQRYIEFQKTPGGIKALAADFRNAFCWYDTNPGKADNQLLSLAELTGYSFPQYGNEAQAEAIDKASDLFSMVLASPQLVQVLSDSSLTKEEKQARIISALASDPKQSKKFFRLFLSMGAALK
jgi:hypothetical protein